MDEQRPESKAHPRKNGNGDRDVIPCHTWTLEGVDPVQLPSIPLDLPELRHGEGEGENGKGLKLIKIASMDNNLIGLTNRGHILRYHKLAGEDEYRLGRWEYVSP